ncbi:hypothetical protein MLD38_018270 [Melastoma candidum]|uniref:Uncharacterized protein n=1 Tax=Melastoma candidum TaxID=119954 RepID=A0ACB9QUL8_9MYRT|nr:hypothetical protein MLD38_018270 [Melastoma candidum]
MALRIAPNVPEPLVVVPPENTQQVIGNEHSVVVPHHEPPHPIRGVRTPERLGDYPRYPDGRPVPLPVPVLERRCVPREPHRRQQGVLGRGVLHGAVEPDHAPHPPGTPPSLDILLPPRPELGRGRDTENNVVERRPIVEGHVGPGNVPNLDDRDVAAGIIAVVVVAVVDEDAGGVEDESEGVEETSEGDEGEQR